MSNPRDLVRAIFSKTVKNGCTPEEAASARAKGEELCVKYGFKPSEFDTPQRRAQPRTHFYEEPRPFAWDVADFLHQMRAAAAAADARRAAKTKAKENVRKPEVHHPRAKDEAGTFRTIKDCAEHYLKMGLMIPEVLERVRWHFSTADTKEASIRWYASKMRKAGRL